MKLVHRIMSITRPAGPEVVAAAIAYLGQRRRRSTSTASAAGRRRNAVVRFCIGLGFSPLDHYVPLARAADERGLGHHRRVRPRRQPRDDHVGRTRTPRTAARRWEPFTPWADPWVAIGAMAAVTERLRFTTNVYVLPMRTPFHVAKVVGDGRGAVGRPGGPRRRHGLDGGGVRRSSSSRSASGASGPTRCSRCCASSAGAGEWSSTTASSTTSTASRCARRPADRADLRRRPLRRRAAPGRPQRRLDQRPAHHRRAGRDLRQAPALPGRAGPGRRAVLGARRRARTLGPRRLPPPRRRRRHPPGDHALVLLRRRRPTTSPAGSTASTASPTTSSTATDPLRPRLSGR